MVIHQSKWKGFWVRPDSVTKSFFFLFSCRLCALRQLLCISYSISWYDNAIMRLLKSCARACRFVTRHARTIHAPAVAKEPAVPPSPSSWTAAVCVFAAEPTAQRPSSPFLPASCPETLIKDCFCGNKSAQLIIGNINRNTDRGAALYPSWKDHCLSMKLLWFSIFKDSHGKRLWK